MSRTAGDAIPDRCFCLNVLSYAWHETEQGMVRTDSSILEERRGTSAAKLIPTNPSLSAGSGAYKNDVADEKRFIRTEIPIGETRHEPVADGIDAHPARTGG